MEEKKSIFKQIDEFYASSNRNAWLEDEFMKVYVRKSNRMVDGRMHPFFDIGAVEVFQTNNGTFTYFMIELLKKHPTWNLYVESIHNPVLEHILNKLSFVRYNNSDIDINMFKMAYYYGDALEKINEMVMKLATIKMKESPHTLVLEKALDDVLTNIKRAITDPIRG